MDLSRPSWLWLLIPLVIFAALALWSRHRRERAWKALGQGGRLPAEGRVGVLVASLLLILALAQPRWGRDPGALIPPGRDVVFLIDVSRSMGAEDAVPSRLDVAIESASGLMASMAQESGDRVAVVAFAGSGVVRCGLTENLGAAMDVIRKLRPGTVQPGGTDLGAAVEVAAGAFDDRDHAEGRMIVVFTDGEDLAGGWHERIGMLREQGIIVNAVAIGDPDQGHPVPGPGGVITYQGKPVESKRSDEALDALARGTEGVVIRLGVASADLGPLYRDKIAPAARRVRNATHRPERAERYGLFVMAALMAVSIGARPKKVRRSTRKWGLIACLGLLVLFGAGPSGQSAKQLVERGRIAYRSKQYDVALSAFESASKLGVKSPIPQFGAATTLYAMGRYPEAIDRYLEAREFANVDLKIKLDYAVGNASLMANDPESAIEYYDECLASKRQSAVLNAVRRDAKINRDYALLRIKQRVNQEPEPQSEAPKNETSKPAPEPPKTDAGKDEGPNGESPRGQGGAGGSEPKSRPPGGEASPEDRLETALDHVREALKNRLPDSPIRGQSGDLKDW